MPYHNIIPCYVISNKFPRLLAEREIIANAFCLPTMSGNGLHQIQRQRYKDLSRFIYILSKIFILGMHFPYILPHTSRATSAQHVLCSCISADVQAHNSCYALIETIFLEDKNYYYHLPILFLSFFLAILKIKVYLCIVYHTHLAGNKGISSC